MPLQTVLSCAQIYGTSAEAIKQECLPIGGVLDEGDHFYAALSTLNPKRNISETEAAAAPSSKTAGRSVSGLHCIC